MSWRAPHLLRWWRQCLWSRCWWPQCAALLALSASACALWRDESDLLSDDGIALSDPEDLGQLERARIVWLRQRAQAQLRQLKARQRALKAQIAEESERTAALELQIVARSKARRLRAVRRLAREQLQQ